MSYKYHQCQCPRGHAVPKNVLPSLTLLHIYILTYIRIQGMHVLTKGNIA